MVLHTSHIPSSRQHSDEEMGRKTISFVQRHIGPNPNEVQQMLKVLGLDDLNALVAQTVPQAIRLNRQLKLENTQ